MKILFILLTAAILTACIVSPIEESHIIQIVDNKAELNCNFIEVVTGSGSMGWTAAHDAEGAMNEVKNRAYIAGANAVRIINVNSDYMASIIIAEALIYEFR